MTNKEKPNLFEERMDGYGGAYNNSQNYLVFVNKQIKFTH
jgi:hypothetical protein